MTNQLPNDPPDSKVIQHHWWSIETHEGDQSITAASLLFIVYALLASFFTLWIWSDYIDPSTPSHLGFMDSINLEAQLSLLLFQGVFFFGLILTTLIGRSINGIHLSLGILLWQIVLWLQFFNIQLPIDELLLLPLANISAIYPSIASLSQCIYLLVQLGCLILIRTSIQRTPHINTPYIDLAFLSFILFILAHAFEQQAFIHIRTLFVTPEFLYWAQSLSLKMTLIFGVFGSLYASAKPNQNTAQLAFFHWFLICCLWALLLISSPFSIIEIKPWSHRLLWLAGGVLFIIHSMICYWIWNLYRKNTKDTQYLPSLALEFGLLIHLVDLGLFMTQALFSIQSIEAPKIYHQVSQALQPIWGYCLLSFVAHRIIQSTCIDTETKRRNTLFWQVIFGLLGAFILLVALASSYWFQHRLGSAAVVNNIQVHALDLIADLRPLQLLAMLGLFFVALSILLQLISLCFKSPPKTDLTSNISLTQAPEAYHQWIGYLGACLFIGLIYKTSWLEVQHQQTTTTSIQKTQLSPLAIEGQEIFMQMECKACHQASNLHAREIMSGALLSARFPFEKTMNSNQLNTFLRGLETDDRPLGHRPSYESLHFEHLTGETTLVKTLQNRNTIQQIMSEAEAEDKRKNKHPSENTDALIQASYTTAGETKLNALVQYILETSSPKPTGDP